MPNRSIPKCRSTWPALKSQWVLWYLVTWLQSRLTATPILRCLSGWDVPPWDDSDVSQVCYLPKETSHNSTRPQGWLSQNIPSHAFPVLFVSWKTVSPLENCVRKRARQSWQQKPEYVSTASLLVGGVVVVGSPVLKLRAEMNGLARDQKVFYFKSKIGLSD